ncbi:imidazole glycerol phosphate synthase subunit HisH [Acetoanaerobium noterae]|uniref:imidazole glycerol phosphate synthase subunit HisH n=1 Tax=Acetoanaerobium noterae TaxID=745369 RepID=UPI003340ED56
MIAVIDYGVGNVGSIINMLKKIGDTPILAKNASDIKKADKLILPGVGSFDTGMRMLRESGMLDEINNHVTIKEKPLLGICLGMQMLGRQSEEGKLKGLSYIPFDNVKFNFDSLESKEYKTPHMGWNVVKNTICDDLIVSNIDTIQRYYFVHSYHALCDKEENILMKCKYGYEFAAAVKHNNVYGFQFHPEKSHKFGMTLLENFARRL